MTWRQLDDFRAAASCSNSLTLVRVSGVTISGKLRAHPSPLRVQFERQLFLVERYVANETLPVDHDRDVGRGRNQIRGRQRTEIAQRFLRRFEHLHQGKYPPPTSDPPLQRPSNPAFVVSGRASHGVRPRPLAAIAPDRSGLLNRQDEGSLPRAGIGI